MRILILTHNFPPQVGGISTHCYEMARHWSRGDEVWVLAPHTSGEDANNFSFAGKIVRMPPAHNKLSRFLVSLESTLRLERKIRPDVIYGTHWLNCGIALRLAGMLAGIPFFLAVHGSEVLELLGPRKKGALVLFRWVAAGCRGFVALGGYQQQILEKLGIDRAKVFTSPEGMDFSRLANISQNDASGIRARHKLVGRCVILTVGRLVERKGHDRVIQALPRILAEVPDAVYLVVGRGPEEDRLRALARANRVEDRVVFCGFVPETELMAYYLACDVFAMPNREVGGDTEGFGIVFVEAGACGKPVVGGRSGGAVEVIRDGVTGFLVDPEDVEETARALVRLLRDPKLAAEFGRAGRARVERQYCYQQIADNIKSFLLGRSLSELKVPPALTLPSTDGPGETRDHDVAMS